MADSPGSPQSPLAPRHIVLTDPGEEYLRQMQASAATAVERLALTTHELDEARMGQERASHSEQEALKQVEHLKALVATLELSAGQYAKRCTSLDSENSELKVQVRDLRNQVMAARQQSELLVDSNSALTTQLVDVQRELKEKASAVEGLRQDIKSYELLQQSQPSYMYAELSAEARLGLQEENANLRKQVYRLNAKASSLGSPQENVLPAPPNPPAASLGGLISSTSPLGEKGAAGWIAGNAGALEVGGAEATALPSCLVAMPRHGAASPTEDGENTEPRLAQVEYASLHSKEVKEPTAHCTRKSQDPKPRSMKGQLQDNGPSTSTTGR
eukprot:CAMPEP_0172634690 /NCGR_PEP_ID=MMETSP1068-20121228/195751_1 /TAXON_ID=35684 /ORGANISM="Pseudopedinella elastica, Strain CCMP716" /LENGTH=329 /DNA_ID=CAMNT_0013446675 /DNA_START=62 /DNA_END=1049 /DNA_ORIENTATION=+